VLFCGAFAETDSSSIILPKSLKQFHFTYEGTWATSKNREIPVNGELFLVLKGNKLCFLDNANLDFEGKSYNVRSLLKVDTKMKTLDSFVTINNKCVVSHYTKDKGTFPRFSGWKEIGNNKFEITARNHIALKQILAPKLGKALAERADKAHDFRARLVLTLKKNKISDAVLKYLMDNKEVVTKSIKVIENIEGKIEEKVFDIPAICKNPTVDQQRKSLDLQMRLLGINLNSEEDKETEKGEQEQETQAEVKELDKGGMSTGSQEGEVKGSEEEKMSSSEDPVKESKDEGMSSSKDLKESDEEDMDSTSKSDIKDKEEKDDSESDKDNDDDDEEQDKQDESLVDSSKVPEDKKSKQQDLKSESQSGDQ
jgi:hypothetical protein